MAEYVIYSPISPARKLDAAEHVRAISPHAPQAGGVGLNRVAMAALGDRICRGWRDHSRIDW